MIPFSPILFSFVNLLVELREFDDTALVAVAFRGALKLKNHNKIETINCLQDIYLWGGVTQEWIEFSKI